MSGALSLGMSIYKLETRDGTTISIEMCPEPKCVLADGHPPGKHAERRVSMLACVHNIPNFGPECPICDFATTRLAAEMRYKMYGDTRHR